MSSAGAARAVGPVSNARTEASRKNGARSRGPNTAEGKARAAQNALKHGMRAQKYLVLPDEDAAEFGGLEAALVEELAPVGALQAVLARRVAVAAWRLARADRIETELFEERRVADGGLGLALLGRRVGERGPNPVPAAKRRQWPAFVRNLAPLPRRGDGRVLARAAHAQGAPGRAGAAGRAGARDRCRPGDAPAAARGAAAAHPPSPTERTRALPRTLSGIPAERGARFRRPARVR
jgi:hypothetical protein